MLKAQLQKWKIANILLHAWLQKLSEKENSFYSTVESDLIVTV